MCTLRTSCWAGGAKLRIAEYRISAAHSHLLKGVFVAGIAQAAARARIMAAFALEGNLADCTRAGQTQSKLMSILGTAAGVCGDTGVCGSIGLGQEWTRAYGHDHVSDLAIHRLSFREYLVGIS